MRLIEPPIRMLRESREHAALPFLCVTETELDTGGTACLDLQRDTVDRKDGLHLITIAFPEETQTLWVRRPISKRRMIDEVGVAVGIGFTEAMLPHKGELLEPLIATSREQHIEGPEPRAEHSEAHEQHEREARMEHGKRNEIRHQEGHEEESEHLREEQQTITHRSSSDRMILRLNSHYLAVLSFLSKLYYKRLK